MFYCEAADHGHGREPPPLWRIDECYEYFIDSQKSICIFRGFINTYMVSIVFFCENPSHMYDNLLGIHENQLTINETP